ncbi:hypothetical protein PaeBR_23495 [Paenibacillus sp. BR2-3]|uniref:hypothetical protein n=1 Tax=Paenibacillus sp. BR2-3 TaxID=3048494 RepID=UPI0039778CB0
MTSIIGFIVAIIALSILSGLMQGSKKKRKRSARKRQMPVKKTANFNRSSTTCRSAEVILMLGGRINLFKPGKDLVDEVLEAGKRGPLLLTATVRLH